MPPVPADTAVALGAFLAARGAPVHVLGVYGVTVVANVASAIGMYYVALTVGRSFLETRTGRRLLSASAQGTIERAYQRYHLWGIFVSRFLPGYRAVVPPFAGIARLPAPKALPPMAIASAIYYGIIVAGAYRVGASWEAVLEFVRQVSLELLVLALAVTLVLGFLFWQARRARRRRQATDGR